MDLKFRHLTILAITLFLASCATTQSISNEVRTKIYEDSYDNVFRTIVQTFSDAGYVLDTADPETGIINTDYSQASEWEAFWSGDERQKINALISKQGDQTRVRLTVSVQNKAAFTGWQNKNMSQSKAEEYYEKLFAKISENINSLN